MEVVYEHCCGVDVHKKMIMACLRTGKRREIREFGTSTKALREMAVWLERASCQMVALESTGSYWKPVYNVLEVLGLDVMVGGHGSVSLCCTFGIVGRVVSRKQ